MFVFDLSQFLIIGFLVNNLCYIEHFFLFFESVVLSTDTTSLLSLRQCIIALNVWTNNFIRSYMTLIMITHVEILMFYQGYTLF